MLRFPGNDGHYYCPMAGPFVLLHSPGDGESKA
jgi:hypothetical protein